MTWITIAQIPTPAINEYATTADFMLAYAVYDDLRSASLNFLSGQMGPQYVNPAAYKANLIAYAESLKQNKFAVPYAPSTWDADAAAKKAYCKCFMFLQELPVNIGDPDTVSIFIAWVAGTGSLYGGHPASTSASSGSNLSTGQSAVSPAGGPSIL
jgi:hypothetical protein